MSNKICPKCKSYHEKTGIFYSRSCANSRGKRTEEFKQKVRKKLIGKPSKIKGREIIPRVLSNCFNCNKIVKIQINDSRKYITCKSKKCLNKMYQMAGKTSASIQCKRSKDEIALFEMCKKFFNVDHNIQIANGWDADILIYDYKLAILWNGPFHYKDMGLKKHSVNQVVNRDCIKIQEFEKIGWNVLIYEDRYWNPMEAFVDILIKTGRGGRTRTA